MRTEPFLLAGNRKNTYVVPPKRRRATYHARYDIIGKIIAGDEVVDDSLL
ncbi:hypothetical protein HMPREF3201_01471 [Megasphaera sp. MJR8396C]|nr:hypothetical protein HMPREF3201_01471 [Megasphaera sp. MJR8396C]